MDHDALALAELRRGAVEVPGGQALYEERERGAVFHALGKRERGLDGRQRVLRVAPAPAGHGDDARALGHLTVAALDDAHHLTARNQRQLLLRHVCVLPLVGVGEVDPGAGDPYEHLTIAGCRHVEVHEIEHLGASELRELDRAHRAPEVIPRPRTASLSRP